MSATKLKLGVTLLVAVGLTGPGVSAYQGPDPGPTASQKRASKVKTTTETKADVIKPNNPVEAPRDPSGRTAVQIAQDALASFQPLLDSKQMAPTDPRLALWQRRLVEAQSEEGDDAAGAVKHYIELARSAEASAKSRYESKQISQLDYLNAQYERIEAEKLVSGILTKRPLALWQPSINGLAPGLVPHGDTIGVDPPEPPRLRRLPKPNPADAERNKKIEQVLEERLTMPFPNVGTPLEDILKYIRNNTASKELDFPNGIQIYVDPFALVDESVDPPKMKTLKTIAPIDLEGIPLRVTLRLVLDQFALSYQVRDQMVYIMDEEGIDMRYNGGFVGPPTNPNIPGGTMGGGMGGMMGGGMGGMMGGGRRLNAEPPSPSDPPAKK